MSMPMNREMKNMAVSEQFEKRGDGLLVRVPGKVNLSLLVKGKRADGYHDIESIMAKIDWYDEILIERRTEDRGQRTEDRIENSECRIQNAEQKAENGGQANIQYPIPNVECPSETNIELICKGEYKVPEGEENLVYKAARLILEEVKSNPRLLHAGTGKEKVKKETEKLVCGAHPTNVEEFTGWKPVPQVKITLTKNMPAGSGLGSGSSDAAATLMGVNKFLKLGLGQRELVRLAAELGSDVAFFLDGPIALCTGKGEKVKKLEKCEFRAFVIVPDVSVSTKRVYENYRHDEVKYRRLSEEINIYIEKKRIDLICGMCANMLEESCFEMHPELGVLKKKIESLGIRPVGLSGSGSSMFCIINNRNEEGVKTYRDKLEQELGCKSIIVNNNSW